MKKLHCQTIRPQKVQGGGKSSKRENEGGPNHKPEERENRNRDKRHKHVLIS